MRNNSATVVLDHITKSFGEFTAVNDLSLEVHAGRIFGLIGPNGAGKTTTIRMIVNITAPDTGRISLFGQQITPELQDRIGYLPEERGLYKKMKVGDQLKFFAELKSIDTKEAEKRVDRWLERLKLTEWKGKKASDLSKGMQQKIQFITSVIHEPDLLILDEPFSGLDPVNVDLLKEIVLDLKNSRQDDHLFNSPDGSGGKDLRRHLSHQSFKEGFRRQHTRGEKWLWSERRGIATDGWR